ncbi:MAG: response regulator transcription factor [Pseudomonadota bacterium]
MNAIEKRVLVVEDDPSIADLLKLHLEDEVAELGFCDDGRDGLAAARSGDWDLLLLDVRLPGMSGLDVCRTLRGEGFTLPIIMLTAKSGELDQVLGLEIGADDYVTKPFSVIGLLARVRAHLRRAEMAASTTGPGDRLELGDVRIDPATRRVSVRGEPVQLTAREFDLLIHFARHPDQVFPRSQLLDEVWGYGHEGYEHTVNAHINRLRGKIERDPRQPELIATVWGVGYRFTPVASASAEPARAEAS